jgi:Tol biopolymer transport system component
VTAAAGGIVLSADGTSSAFRTSNGIAVRRCGRRPTLVFRGAATPLAFAPSGGRLVARRRCRSGACPLLVVGGARPLDITARADTGTPVWSPDGRSIAFIAPDGHVLVVDAATGATLAAGDTGTATTTLGGWHGTELVYGTRAQPNASSIERLDPTTGEYEPLTIGAAPALSADGRTLAFTRAGGIWVRDANGAERLLAEVDATTLAWARDGRSLAYGSNDEIGVVTLDGARRRIVFAPRVVAGVLAWTPDSASIAYARRPEASEGTSVWLVSTDGRANRPFLSHAQSVAWSPDGSRLAYLTDGGGLSVAAADGSDPQVRAAVGFGYPVPTIAWSADGDTILVLRSVVHPVIGGSFSRVVAVAADGSGTVELTDGSTYLASLAIAP